MSYQVLARKWRPATFHEMVGQEHVLKALINALDTERLHHAYLFTGTRGVGKTSIARLFAKALNCEQGVSSKPCGQCSPCREISEGRFVDLIEVDAASRTKVEDTRELLENVQYAPSQGRYKVYLIDEVHMLSTSSFNALLKTLEEPPPHIKFLLATTDPQKLPVTILSRCLQFSLKNMLPERIVTHLAQVLTAEQIAFEEQALWLLARGANGSMRDAMSLTDQAIAFCSGTLTEADVGTMLGTVDQNQVLGLLQALVEGSAKVVLQRVSALTELGGDCDAVLAELMSLLHRIGIAQMAPDALDNSQGNREALIALGSRLRAEDSQLFYQIALNARRDLPHVPDPQQGLEMALLRMLAFRPVLADEVALPQRGGSAIKEGSPSTPIAENVEASGNATPSAAVLPTAVPPATALGAEQPPSAYETSVDGPTAIDARQDSVLSTDPLKSAPRRDSALEPPPWLDEPSPLGAPSSPGESPPWGEPAKKFDPLPMAGGREVSDSVPTPCQLPESLTLSAVGPESSSESIPIHSAPPAAVPHEEPAAVEAEGAPADEIETAQSFRLPEIRPDSWVALFAQLPLSGMTHNLAANSTLVGIEQDCFRFQVTAHQFSLFNATHQQRVAEALSDYFGEPLRVALVEGQSMLETPAQYAERKKQERQAEAVQAMQTDPTVQQLIARFDAQLLLDSVQPIDL